MRRLVCLFWRETRFCPYPGGQVFHGKKEEAGDLVSKSIHLTFLAMRRLTCLFALLLSFTAAALAQSGNAGRPYHRTRSVERAYDLPYLTVETPQPGRAADLTTVVIYAPDSMDIGLTVGEWMSNREPAWQKEQRIGPGRQELTLPLYALADGDYTLRVYRRNRVVAAKHFVVAK